VDFPQASLRELEFLHFSRVGVGEGAAGLAQASFVDSDAHQPAGTILCSADY